MADEPLPDGIAEGETAYVVASNYLSGVGGFPVTHRVRVVRITATQVKVADYPDDRSPRTFRRRDLTAPRAMAGGYRDDRLAPRDDPEVRRAHLIARVVAALPEYRELDEQVRVIDRVSVVELASNPQAELDRQLAALATLRDLASKAHARLLREREALG